MDVITANDMFKIIMYNLKDILPGCLNYFNKEQEQI